MFWIRSGLHSVSLADWLTAGPALAAGETAPTGEARRAERPSSKAKASSQRVDKPAPAGSNAPAPLAKAPWTAHKSSNSCRAFAATRER